MAGQDTGFSFQDSSLVDELLNPLELDPTNIEAKKLLAQQWQTLGWDDAAANLAGEILAVQPGDQEAKFILESSRRRENQQGEASEEQAPPPYSASIPVGPSASHGRNVPQLKSAYKTLIDDAKNLLQDLLCFKQVAPSAKCDDQVADLTALSEGRVSSVARRTVGQTTTKATKPISVRALASSMKSTPRRLSIRSF